jgi:hypothetical protein
LSFLIALVLASEPVAVPDKVLEAWVRCAAVYLAGEKAALRNVNDPNELVSEALSHCVEYQTRYARAAAQHLYQNVQRAEAERLSVLLAGQINKALHISMASRPDLYYFSAE